MIGLRIHYDVRNIEKHINILVNSLNSIYDVDTDSKRKILNNEINVDNLWFPDASRMQKLKVFFSTETFSISNENAKLTKFDDGSIKYEDLASKTILNFEKYDQYILPHEYDYGNNISIEENGHTTPLSNPVQQEKFLSALKILKNIQNMQNKVEIAMNNLGILDSEIRFKNRNNVQPNDSKGIRHSEPSKSELRIAAVLERINKINSNNESNVSHEPNKPKS